MRKRCAFTLIELLVVIAIIGVLIGLLLPRAAERLTRPGQIRRRSWYRKGVEAKSG